MVWTPKRQRRPWRDFLTAAEADTLSMVEKPKNIFRASMKAIRARIVARASARARRAGAKA